MNKQVIINNIKTPNTNLEILKKNFSHCFNKEGNFNFEKFKQELSKNEDIDFSNESYGMDWLGKSYARLLACDEAITFLKENEDWNKKPQNKNSENLLIKGDNLEVLKHLSNAYFEKIKMIYIDPPYNTGGDGFVYQDDRKFSVEELSKLAGIDKEKAKRILEFTQSKSNSHSAWLTFMYPRLYIAKQLLKDDGVIFVSIDDNEVAQLRLLMDEIFGEENFVANLIWKKKAGGANDSITIAIEHEYILCYLKEKNGIYKKPMQENTLKKYKEKDSKFETHGYYTTKNLCDFSLQDSKGLHYDIICPDKTILKGIEHQWKCNKETFDKRLKDDRIVFRKKDNIWQVYYKIYLNEEKGILKYDLNGNIVKKGVNLSSILNVGLNSESATTIKELFQINIFEYSKPISLITELLFVATKKDDIVLDFFAGSGTTGDAVMQLNAEDNGNRKYILVQLPEIIDLKKNSAAYDFVKNELKLETPTIFDITKERLIRAAKKIQDENVDKPAKSEKVKCDEFQGEQYTSCKGEYTIKVEATKAKALSNVDFGFKVFETISNNEGNWENYILDAESFDSQTKLFDERKLNKEDLKTLLTTWKAYDGFPLTQNLNEIDLDDYIGHYLENKLYLMNIGFETKHLKKLLEEIDGNKNFNPTTIIVFGYNFKSKMLRELADNVKNYANKKHIDIDFILRY